MSERNSVAILLFMQSGRLIHHSAILTPS